MSTAPFLMVRVLDDRIRTREQAIEGPHWHFEKRSSSLAVTSALA